MGKDEGRSDSLARLARDERHLRSKNRRSDLQFTLRLSQLAAFFIDARAERSTVQSLSVFNRRISIIGSAYNYYHSHSLMMILPQVHLRKPCYDFYFL